MDSNRKGSLKFTCYFCNKTIENETQMGHTAVCSSVLVPCPNKCGSYVPRSNLNRHKRECVNRSSQILEVVPVANRSTYYDSPSPVSTTSLDRHYNGYAVTTADPKLQEEFLKLSKRLARAEHLLQLHQQSVQIPIAQNSQQHIDSIKNTNLQYGLEIEKLKYQNKAVFDWKKSFELQLDTLKRSIAVVQNSKAETDLHWRNLQERLLMLEKQQVDLSYLKDAFFKEQSYSRQSNMDFEQDLNSVKNHFSQEHATFATVLNDQRKSIDDLKSQIEEIRQSQEDQKNKFTNIVFDLRATSQIASEAAERIEIQERDFAEVKKDVNQMKLDLEILEGLSSANDLNIKPGRLIWKITEVKAKLQKAKDFNSVLKSPVFYTHEYGYKIKLLMYMNGLKKWKDRYALLCIHVLKGEYDMLQKWPCSIEATIALRTIDEKGKPFSKFITAKRDYEDEETEEPQESSSTYIFIPHSTLLKDYYVKEDTLFLDVKIQKNSKLETSL